MSRFYRIESCLDIEILGEYVQVESSYGAKVHGAANTPGKIPFNQPIDFDLQLANLILYPNSKFTDIISHNYHGIKGITISDNAKEIFEDFNLDNYQVSPCFVKRGREVRPYWTLYLTYHRSNYINWTDCRFIKWQNMGYVNAGETRIEDFEHYRKREKASPYSVKPIHFSLVSNVEVDMFRLTNPYRGIYLSGRMQEAINKAKLTGFVFASIEDLNKKYAAIPPPWPGYENQ